MKQIRWTVALITFPALLAGQSARAAEDSVVKIELASIEASDGVRARGTLYTVPSKRPTTVLVSMHPNGSRLGIPGHDRD